MSWGLRGAASAVLFAIFLFHTFELRAATSFAEIEFSILSEFAPILETQRREAEEQKRLNDEYARELSEKHKNRLSNPTAKATPIESLPPPGVTSQQIQRAVELTRSEANLSIAKFNASKNEYSELSLSNQFSYERDQAESQTCATFASIGLLEAAYFRENKKKMDFSEMWVMRSELGLGILNNKNSAFRAFELSLRPTQMMEDVKARGVCSEEKYIFSSTAANQFFNQKMGHAENVEEVYEENLRKFYKYFGSPPQVQNCQIEAASRKEEFSGYHSLLLENANLSRVIHFLSFGIPIFVTVDMLPGGSPLGSLHSILLTGYDNKTKSFMIRNSWGRSARSPSPRSVPFSWMDTGKNGYTHMMGFQIILSPSDIQRACRNPDAAPVQILEYCPRPIDGQLP